MSRRTIAEAEIDAVYATIPDAGCKGLCAQSCGPISMSLIEWQRIERVRGSAIPRGGDELKCPMLTDEHRCSVYAVRPLICRLFGSAERLPCEHGCVPAEGLLTREQVGAAMIAIHAASPQVRHTHPHLSALLMRLRKIKRGKPDGRFSRATGAARGDPDSGPGAGGLGARPDRE